MNASAKMQPKWFVAALSIAIFLLLAGCGQAATSTPLPSATEPPATTANPVPTTTTLAAVPELSPTATPTSSPAPTSPPPAQSPAGLVVFYSERDGDADIYLMNPDGSQQRPLTDNEADDTSPSWSPDGRLIAFESDRDDPNPHACFPNCNYNLYVMNADGS